MHVILNPIKVYVTLNPYKNPMPSSFPVFCAVFGVLNEAADSSLDFYLFYFIVYTFLNMKTSIKASKSYIILRAGNQQKGLAYKCLGHIFSMDFVYSA